MKTGKIRTRSVTLGEARKSADVKENTQWEEKWRELREEREERPAEKKYHDGMKCKITTKKKRPEEDRISGNRLRGEIRPEKPIAFSRTRYTHTHISRLLFRFQCCLMMSLFSRSPVSDSPGICVLPTRWRFSCRRMCVWAVCACFSLAMGSDPLAQMLCFSILVTN